MIVDPYTGKQMGENTAMFANKKHVVEEAPVIMEDPREKALIKNIADIRSLSKTTFSVVLECPMCDEQIKTEIRRQYSIMQWCACTGCWAAGCWAGCFASPFCIVNC